MMISTLLRAIDASGLASLERIYPKALLLSSASYLEAITVEAVGELFHLELSPQLRIFVERRSLNHQFHSLFEWGDKPSAAKFFSFLAKTVNRDSGSGLRMM
jgi:hypothetical protein